MLRAVGGWDGETTKRLWATHPPVTPILQPHPSLQTNPAITRLLAEAKQSADGGAVVYWQPRACFCAGERDTFFRGEKPLQEGEEQ